MPSFLLVDDDEVFCYSFKRVCDTIPELEYIDTAGNGQEGLDYIANALTTSKKLPTHIFLDINMPIMNGFEFLAGIKNLEDIHNGPLTSFVVAMLTSSSNETDRERAAQSGTVDHYLLKPANTSELLDIVLSVLSKTKQTD